MSNNTPPIPKRPTPGTGNARLLDALLAAYPHAVWQANSRLNITAHSRAAELRTMGWDIQSVHRVTTEPHRIEYGYTVRPPATLPPPTSGNTAPPKRRPVASLSERLTPASEIARRTNLSMTQLRYLDRMKRVVFDSGDGRVAMYGATSARMLESIGELHRCGIGIDTAYDLLRYHSTSLATALRLIASTEVAS